MSRWCDEHAIDEGQGGRFELGPTTLWIEHRKREWRISHVTRSDPADLSAELRCPIEPETPDEGAETVRCAVANEGKTLRLVPRLADRPVVIRPETPFRLVPDAEVRLYVTTPVWIEVTVGEVIHELATFRPSDTWFGPDTTRGELCYASRSSARVDLEELPIHPARAVTALDLTNEARESLFVERINLPTTNLSVYVSEENGRLWTESVQIQKKGEGLPPETRIGDKPPTVAGTVRSIGEPRKPEQPNVVLRAFSAFVS